ncbi:hypothetical protein P43SY_005910 [Pythium insidiosum]|uniref:Protein-serine/threonine phosphatase n=1 Tax=Pythium insidiosum TaxID=114742 RepID=A0AAD5LLK8_PYTIN|nr:hypothetical protein P43SY_005910 [Pythium insidiosum]
MTVTLEQMMELFRGQKALSVEAALAIIHDAQHVFNAEPNIVGVEAATSYVFGDIHGQYFDLIALMDRVGLQQLVGASEALEKMAERH